MDGNSTQSPKKPTTVPPLISPADSKDDPDAPPLVSLKVTNPVTYLKLWWQKVMAGEGLDFKIHIHPVTAIAIAAVLLAGGAGVGYATKTVLTKVPVVKDFIPTPSPEPTLMPTPDPWKETAFTGKLKQTGEKFYLVTNEAEAITLQVPTNVNLSKFVEKRILAIGSFNKETSILVVSNATDLEVLLQATAIPTNTPAASISAELSANN